MNPKPSPLNPTSSGQTMMEVLIGATLFSSTVLLLLSSLSFVPLSQARALNNSKATLLSQEAVEVSYNVTHTDWEAVTPGVYHPQISGSTWSLAAGSQTINNIFTRSITVTNVYRNATGQIVTQGTPGAVLDPNSKQIVALVTWTDRDKPQSVSVTETLLSPTSFSTPPSSLTPTPLPPTPAPSATPTPGAPPPSSNYFSNAYFSQSSTYTTLAANGNTADPNEYLASSSRNYQFSFDPVPANQDYVWLGDNAKFQTVNFDFVTPGAGSSINFNWNYWNGSAWSPLTVSGASTWTANGAMNFTPPANWAPTSVNSSPSLYYLRGNLATAPTPAPTPFTNAYFAQNLTWSSTLQNPTAVTSPDVGNGGGDLYGVDFVSAKYAAGAAFFDDNDRIQVTVANGVDYNKTRGAVEFWFKPNYASTDNLYHHLFALRYNDSNTIRIYKGNLNSLHFNQIQAGTNVTLTIPPANYSWSAGNWIHILATWDDSAGLATQQRIFLNGIEPGGGSGDSTTDLNSSVMTNPNLLVIGNSVNSALEANGVIDEFRIYNSPTTPTKLAANGNTADPNEYLASSSRNQTLNFSSVDANKRGPYLWAGHTAPFTNLQTNLQTIGSGTNPQMTWQYYSQQPPPGFPFLSDPALKGLWYLDEASGTRMDQTSNNNDLTDVNTVTTSTDAIQGTYSARFASASNEFLTINDNSSLDFTNSFTLAAWVKFTTLTDTNGHVMIAKYRTSGADQRSYMLWAALVNGVYKPTLNLSIDGINHNNAIGATPLDTNTWYHMAAVYNGTDARMYLNGQLDTNGSWNPRAQTGSIYNGPTAFRIGTRSDGSWYFNGLLDEAAVFARALSATEINQLYLGQQSTASWKNLAVNPIPAGSSNFTTSGNFSFTQPSDWSPMSINGTSDLYYLRGFLSSGSYSTSPVESTISISSSPTGGIYTTYPTERTITVVNVVPTPTQTTPQSSQGSDDATEDDVTFNTDSIPWIGNGQSESNSYLGLRFASVNIPANATINSATIRVKSNQLQNSPAYIRTYGEKISNSPTFSTSNKPSMRSSLTTNSNQTQHLTTWNKDSWYTIADVTQIVPELIATPGWTAGNPLTFIIKGTGTSWQLKTFYGYDQNPTDAAQLIINYQ